MSCTVLSARRARLAMAVLLTGVLGGCGGGGSSSAPAAPIRISGSVGDGPVVDAMITVFDATGAEVAKGTASGTARYDITVAAGAKRPLRVVATGGRDLVTGRPVEFELVSMVTGTGPQTLNLSPMSSLISHAAKCSGAVTAQSLNAAWDRVESTLSMGLDGSKIDHPVSSNVNAANVATVLLANEALGEAVRRAHTAMQNAGNGLTHDKLLEKLACDLSDGQLDGKGGSADPRLTATFRAVEAEVLLETIAGRLEVDGRDATALLDASIRTILPSATDASVKKEFPTDAMVRQTRRAIAVLEGAINNPELKSLGAALDTGDRSALRGTVDALLTPAVQTSIETVKDAVALADSSAITNLQARMSRQVDARLPVLSFSTAAESVDSGSTVLLSWATADAESCQASEGWSGNQPVNGSSRTPALRNSTLYTLSCSGLGGSVRRSVIVNVRGQPAIVPPPPVQEPVTTPVPVTTPAPVTTPPSETPSLAPTVTLTTDRPTIKAGETVTLAWTSRNATSCEADRGWQGVLPTNGSRLSAALSASTTFGITCTSTGGSAVALVSVAVTAAKGLTLSWSSPAENEDGTPANLAGFRVYFGQQSGQYPNRRDVADPNATSIQIEVVPGTYYLVMTAIDRDGQESDHSNELVRVVN